MGADPKSSLGTAFAFNAPNQQSLALSNVSVLLEYASRAFLKGFNEGKQRQSEQALQGTPSESPRTKRQNTFAGNNLISERSTLARVDITPFVPAQQYSKYSKLTREREYFG